MENGNSAATAAAAAATIIAETVNRSKQTHTNQQTNKRKKLYKLAEQQ